MLAAAIDFGLMLGWALLMAALQPVVALLGVPIRFGPFGYNLFSLLLIVLPVTIAFTVLEAGRYEATPGKLKVGLRVRTDPLEDRVTWARSLARNLLKLGLPWSLGQSAALALLSDPTLDAILGAILASVVPLAYLVSLFVGDGRTIYDWLTGTQVITVAAGRRFAEPAPEPEEPQAEPETPAPRHQVIVSGSSTESEMQADTTLEPPAHAGSPSRLEPDDHAVADDPPVDPHEGWGRRVQSS
jgi:uncharacterized RDD family membrane protein YckC